MKRYLTLFIVFIITVVFTAMLFACGGAPSDNPEARNDAAEQESGQEAEQVSGQETEEPDRFQRFEPDLPAMDFDGYEFNVLHWFVGLWGFDKCEDIVVEELNGEVFNDAVFNRNKAVEEKYNIKINLVRMDIGDIINNVRRMVSAGDEAYDLIYQRMHEVMGMVTSGMFYNLNYVPHVNFDMPWWDKRSVEGLSLGGKVYLAASDISTSGQAAIACLVFNKQLAEDYSFENLYDVVLRGDWTIDYMTELCRNKARDLNGDGELDYNDFIPFGTNDFLTTMLFHSAGGRFAEKDENDFPVYTFLSERSIDICGKVLEFMYNQELCINNDVSGGDFMIMFENGQTIFSFAQMASMRDLRAMETDFGILPAPKYNESQESYYSTISIHQAGLASVPVNASDLDRTGVILEALSAESRWTVQPAYYEISLKGKFVRDEESADMLDIIFNTRVYDLGEVAMFGQFSADWLRIVSNKQRDIVSMYERKERQIQSDIDRLITALEKFD